MMKLGICCAHNASAGHVIHKVTVDLFVALQYWNLLHVQCFERNKLLTRNIFSSLVDIPANVGKCVVVS